jgi:hypothetical protein
MEERVSWWTLVNSIVLSENEDEIQEFLLGFQSAEKTAQHLYDDLISIHARAIYRLGMTIRRRRRRIRARARTHTHTHTQLSDSYVRALSCGP